MLDWAKEKCMLSGVEFNDRNLRETIGDVFDLIRFPVMTIKEFGKFSG